MKEIKIAVLAGDGIGPEIMAQAVKAVDAVAAKFDYKVTYTHAIVGAAAIDAVGDPYPEATHQICMEADAVLFGAIGDPRFDNNPEAKVRPEQGLLAMRKKGRELLAWLGRPHPLAGSLQATAVWGLTSSLAGITSGLPRGLGVDLRPGWSAESWWLARAQQKWKGSGGHSPGADGGTRP